MMTMMSPYDALPRIYEIRSRYLGISLGSYPWYPDPCSESFTGTAGVVPAADLEKCQLLKVENFKFNKSYLVPW